MPAMIEYGRFPGVILSALCKVRLYIYECEDSVLEVPQRSLYSTKRQADRAAAKLNSRVIS